MDYYSHYNSSDRRLAVRRRAPTVRWVKEWVPQELAATGRKCSLFRWVKEHLVKSMTEPKEAEEAKPEPTTEILFLCSHEGCGKTFVDVGALKKHAHVHGERQHICHYAGCGKKFLDSSKLKRHFLIHTGARDYVCPQEGCGKAFSLDFNLRAHMKTHSAENYHICHFPDCGKRYINEMKLRTHMKTHHEKTSLPDLMKFTPLAEKPHSTPKTPASVYGSASPSRPYVCPYEGCGKAYIHEYKLNLHLRREHPGHNEENGKHANAAADQHAMDEGGDQDVDMTAMADIAKSSKRSRPSSTSQKAKKAKKANNSTAPTVVSSKMSYYYEDSEETEEDQGNNVEDGWKYSQMNGGDDEETEDED